MIVENYNKKLSNLFISHNLPSHSNQPSSQEEDQNLIFENIDFEIDQINNLSFYDLGF